MIERIQAYMREKARAEHRIRFSIPPFTLFRQGLNSYAIPDNPSLENAESVFAHMREDAQKNQRQHYVTFIREFAPDLEGILQAANFIENRNRPLMTCTPETLAALEPIEGLSIIMSSSESPFEEVKEGWIINSLGFGEAIDPVTVDLSVDQFQRTLITARGFTARLNGEGVSAGMYVEIRDGVTELVGITTLEAYRQRGIAGVLTSYMAQKAFEHGVEIVYLIAANEAASRVYERVGFRHVGSLLEHKLEI